MGYRSNVLVPYKFYSGDRLNPEHLNGNALALDQAARWLLRHRYTYFKVNLPFGLVPTSPNAGYAAFKLQADADFDILAVELHAEDHDAAVSLSADLTGFTTVSVDGASEPQSAIVNQGDLAWTDGTEVNFTLTTSATGNHTVWAGLHMRHDRLSGLSLPTMPRVKADDTTSAAEWNTWFSALKTTLDSATTNWPYARRMEVVTMGEDGGITGVITDNQDYSRQYLNGRTGYLESAYVYAYGDNFAGSSILTATLYDQDNARNVWVGNVNLPAAFGWVSDLTDATSNPTLDSAASDSGLYLSFTHSGDVSRDLRRAIAQLNWRE